MGAILIVLNARENSILGITLGATVFLTSMDFVELEVPNTSMILEATSFYSHNLFATFLPLCSWLMLSEQLKQTDSSML